VRAAFANVPIVAFTAHAMQNEHDQAISEGFDAVIAKPCLPEELITLIHPFLDEDKSDPEANY
jgi:CheY-like chemotaxis protein